ncbi:MAG TPA: phage portal protein [Pyrinomonadaceae bacterium]|nr:phage portal protein [Pyrinomonadaceae bacterium]
MNKDIEKILADLRLSGERYAKPTRYYDGDHDLAFATQKFENAFGTLFREFALNLCPVICDAVRDKLRVTGFGVDSIAGEARDVSAGSRHSDTRRIWHTNRMDTRAGEVHKDALKNGDAYIIVWPNARGEAVFYPNRAATITVTYDEDSPGLISRAAKYWLDADKHVRLNLFYPDRIEKYISRGKSEGAFPEVSDLIPGSSLRPSGSVSAGSRHSDAVVPNPFGVVPVFHFANNADIGQLGRSELEAAIPVQDGLNKSVLDMLVAMEFAAYRQRWAAGIEVEYDKDGKTVAPFKAGVEHLWIANDPSARFGDFEAAQLEQFLKVKDGFRVDIASVTGTPLHYLLQNTGGFPSGESLKKAETRFLAKVRDRQTSFGQVWADVMEFALRIEGRKTARLITEWEDPAPMSEREVLENILLKKQIGLPVEQALLEAGYGEADVKSMKER